MRFVDQVVIVTGAGKGLGAEIARQFAQEKASVILVSRTENEIERVAQEIKSGGGKAIACKADISIEDDVKKVINMALQEWGKVSVLVNNAAVFKENLVTEMSLEDWKYQLDVNLTGPFLCCKHVLPVMIVNKYGKIINISSSAAKHVFKGYSAYAASKAGLVSFSQTLAEEVKKYGIDVNSIYLGLTNTENIRGRIPIAPEELLQTEEVAKVILFLASPEAAGFKGTALDLFGNYI